MTQDSPLKNLAILIIDGLDSLINTEDSQKENEKLKNMLSDLKLFD